MKTNETNNARRDVGEPNIKDSLESAAEKSIERGTLYLVATPIGNLADITLRALEVLKTSDLIACEDTRHTAKLLAHYQIKTRTISYHEHNEQARATELVKYLREGKTVALVSDAGTPAINDPGFRVVRLCIENEINIVSLPGASAFLSALIVSGLPVDAFLFAGYLPARATQRRARLQQLKTTPATLIFYETPHRIAQALKDAREILGERPAAIARELTKLHEQILRGTLSQLAAQFASEDAPARGEFVLIVDRADVCADETSTQTPNLFARVSQLEAEGLTNRFALKQVARELGIARDEAYRRFIAERALHKSRSD